MHLGKTLIIIFVILLLSFGVYSVIVQKRDVSVELDELKATIGSLEAENAELTSRIEYFNNKDNLIKELKSKFNYVNPGEKLMIIVPNSTSSENTTSSSKKIN